MIFTLVYISSSNLHCREINFLLINEPYTNKVLIHYDACVSSHSYYYCLRTRTRDCHSNFSESLFVVQGMVLHCKLVQWLSKSVGVSTIRLSPYVLCRQLVHMYIIYSGIPL